MKKPLTFEYQKFCGCLFLILNYSVELYLCRTVSDTEDRFVYYVRVQYMYFSFSCVLRQFVLLLISDIDDSICFLTQTNFSDHGLRKS